MCAVGGSPDRIRVVLNGIDPDAFRRGPHRDDIRAALGVAASDVVVGAVGRLEPQKRFDLLLGAIARLAPTHAALQLAVIGDGSLRRDLEAQAAALGIGARCRFLGQRDDIASLHHAFDVFVQSSDYEGTPNAVLEAMAMETPIVATDAGGTRELAEPGVHAVIVPVGDVNALSAGIEAVLQDPAAAQARVVAARHRVECELSFEARTRRLESIYEELVGERTGRLVTASAAASAVRHEAPHA